LLNRHKNKPAHIVIPAPAGIQIKCTGVTPKRPSLVPERKIHFIGFSTNVDDSILKLDLGQPFTVEKKSQGEVAAFL
jgi:hypothetical protein